MKVSVKRNLFCCVFRGLVLGVCVCLIVYDVDTSTIRRTSLYLGSSVTEEEAWTKFICLRIGISDGLF